jgi:WD40 repeat protein
MFGQFILAGDTVGHVMLADTESDDRPQLEGARHRVAPLFVEPDPTGNHAILLFEDGRADWLALADPNDVQQTTLPIEGVTNAVFDLASDRFATATREGEVDLWSNVDGPEKRLHQGGVPVELVSFAEGSERLVALCGDGSVRLWDIESAELLTSIPSPRPIAEAETNTEA